MTKTFKFDVRRTNTAGLIAERARELGDKTFLHYLPDGQRISYLDLDSEPMASALRCWQPALAPGPVWPCCWTTALNWC